MGLDSGYGVSDGQRLRRHGRIDNYRVRRRKCRRASRHIIIDWRLISVMNHELKYIVKKHYTCFL